MKIIEQSWQFEQKPNNLLEVLERAARTCYKSENKIAEGTAETLLKALIGSGHHSVLEHCNISIRLVIDRAVAMEILRHRIGVAYSMESQRYVSYKEGIDFIKPHWCLTKDILGIYDEFVEIPLNCSKKEMYFLLFCGSCEQLYINLIREGGSPEEARVILPNCTKTELFMSMNVRAFRHFFELRCSKKAYLPLRTLALDMLREFHKEWPVLFDDIAETYLKENK